MKLPRLTLPAITRDLSAASSAVATLVTAGLLSGSAERWATAILAALTAAIATLTKSTPTPTNNAASPSGAKGWSSYEA